MQINRYKITPISPIVPTRTQQNNQHPQTSTANFHNLEEYISHIRTKYDQIKNFPQTKAGKTISISTSIEEISTRGTTVVYKRTSSANYTPIPFATYEDTDPITIHQTTSNETYNRQTEQQEFIEEIQYHLDKSGLTSILQNTTLILE